MKTMARFLTRMLWISFSFFISVDSMACPLCETETGKLVRQRISETFLQNFFYTLLPFIFFALIVVISHYGLPIRGKKRGGSK